MKQAMVVNRRRIERLGRTRRRDLWLAGGSLLVHVLVFLLLPGLAVDIAPHRELLIELVKARSAGAAGRSSGVGADARSAASPADAAADTAAPAQRPSQPEQPATSQSSPSTPEPQPQQSNPRANQATSISAAPLAVPQSSQQVQDQQVENEAVPVVDEPVAQPPPKPADQPEATPVQPPQEEAPQESATSEPEGSNRPVTDSPEDNSATGTSQDDAAQEDAEAGNEEGDEDNGGAPPGPSAAELQLLGEYGDAARLRIRSQARNPEQGGEGTVTFEFEVARDGHLIDVRVLRSSGYANLDNDALEATRAAFNERAEKKPFPRDVTVASWTFVMSLKYPLY